MSNKIKIIGIIILILLIIVNIIFQNDELAMIECEHYIKCFPDWRE